MTDKPIRPDSDPSLEPEPQQPDQQVADDASDAVDVAEPTADTAETQPASDAPDDVTGDEVDANETVPVEGVAATVDSETLDTGAEEGTEAEILDVVEESAPEATTEAAPEAEIASADVDSEPDTSSMEPEGTATPAVVDVPKPGTDEEAPDSSARDDVFVWHPEHKGKSFDDVRAALAQDIAADQRQHRLAMDGAEESEQEALASVVGLERKWGPYDFDWAEQEPEELADRILEFERERERRQELISWGDYRDGDDQVDETQIAGERAPELSTSAKGLSLLLVVLLIVVILLAVWAL